MSLQTKFQQGYCIKPSILLVLFSLIGYIIIDCLLGLSYHVKKAGVKFCASIQYISQFLLYANK